jgi:hypothetical protein
MSYGLLAFQLVPDSRRVKEQAAVVHRMRIPVTFNAASVRMPPRLQDP